VKLKATDLTTRLKEMLQEDRSPDALTHAIGELVGERHATAESLGAEIDALPHDALGDVAALKAIRSAVADFVKSQSSASHGKRAHQLQGHSGVVRRPWYADLIPHRPALGPPLYPDPPRAVTVAGVRLEKPEITEMLRAIGRAHAG
jgi:hypothetical protein